MMGEHVQWLFHEAVSPSVLVPSRQGGPPGHAHHGLPCSSEPPRALRPCGDRLALDGGPPEFRRGRAGPERRDGRGQEGLLSTGPSEL